jgi:putative copper resistance protein D
VIPLLLTWLRAAGLAGQAIALGGAILALVVLRRRGADDPIRPRRAALLLCAAGALLAAVAQAGVLVGLAATLSDDASFPLADVLATPTPGVTGLARIALSAIAGGAALAVRRRSGSRGLDALLVAAAGLLPVTSALASHAMGGMQGRAWLVVVGALHQGAAGAWVGGVVCAALLAVRTPADERVLWLRRFSPVAIASVTALALTGMALTLEYVRTPAAAIGTSYGAMVLTKVVLFAALLAMGLANHRALHGKIALAGARRSGEPAPAESPGECLALRRRLEAEAVLALVAVCLAASLASAPPAAEVPAAQRASAAELGDLLAPRWPSFETPSAAELAAGAALDDPTAPRAPEDIAWSEFGHHVAGVFVLAMGVLATLERTGRARWARHWPLLIIVLAGFTAWNMDPEGWQTGTVSFWTQLRDPEVVQHRLLLVLTALFGVAEWRVRSGRHPNSPLRYVFPVVCLGSAVLLVSHVHLVNDVKSGFYMEVSHLPLGLLSLLAGWARWLELRLPRAGSARVGRVWGPALLAFGLVLVLYREG